MITDERLAPIDRASKSVGGAKQCVLLAVLIVGLIFAGALSARAETLTVDFGFFPKGMECHISGTSGKVRLKTGREIEYTIKGDVTGTAFVCTLPDGRSFRIAPGVWYASGARMTAVQINADGRAIVMFDSGGGLVQNVFDNALKWQN